VGSLLARRHTGLSGAERIRLEDHLAACATCRADVEALGALVRLADFGSAAVLGPRARDRAIAGALAAAAPPESAPASPWTRRVWVPSLAAAAVAAAAALFALRAKDDSGPAPTAAGDGDLTLSAGDRVLAGALTGSERRLGPGADIAPALEWSTTEPTVIALGAARLDLAAATTIAWEPEQATVRLRAGAVRAVVEHRPGQRFRVATARFVVEVVGTEFVVDGDRVRVEQGVVRVLASDGQVLAASLAAGSEWTWAPTAAAPTQRLASARAEPAAAAGAGDWLRSARARLADQDVGRARADIDRALAASPSRAEAAEAQSLAAECALVEGDAQGAARLYLAVAERYRDLPAGANALFGAARLEADHGSGETAHRHLLRYLERYPDGPLAAEARARLAVTP
jgi:ferric-dicitrate binding protein FerR (iron transport regulator)